MPPSFSGQIKLLLICGDSEWICIVEATGLHVWGQVAYIVEFPVDTPSCTWDLDGSGSVGTGDLLALFSQWGTDGPADFDESGAVGTGDLLILFANWGPCP